MGDLAVGECVQVGGLNGRVVGRAAGKASFEVAMGTGLLRPPCWGPVTGGVDDPGVPDAVVSLAAPCLPRLPIADLMAAARSAARSISAEGAWRGEAVLAKAAWPDPLLGAARFPWDFGGSAGEETDDPMRPASKLDGAVRGD
jgi:hypothetical protein